MLFGCFENAVRFYTESWRAWRRQWSQVDIAQTQRERLRRLLEHITREDCFYRHLLREISVRPCEAEPKDLNGLPTLTKNDLLRYSSCSTEAQVSSQTQPSPHHQIRLTGGSTGFPFSVVHGKGFIFCQEIRRVRRWLAWGARPGQVHLLVQPGSGSCPPGTLKKYFDKKLLGDIYYLFTSLSPRRHEFALIQPLLTKKRIGLIYAPPFLLAKLSEDPSLIVGREGRPHRIVTGSELLPEDLRRYVEEKWDRPVVDGYGLTETGVVAWQCGSSSGYHIDEDSLIVETLCQGIPVRNVPGEIVVTCLNSESIPIIRYRTGDSGILTDSLCSCGRALPLLHRIEGRLIDHLVCREGLLVSPRQVIDTLGRIVGLDYQVVQDALGRVLVLVPDDKLTPAVEKAVRYALRPILGNVLDLQLDSDSLAVTSGSKKRIVISKYHDATKLVPFSYNSELVSKSVGFGARDDSPE